MEDKDWISIKGSQVAQLIAENKILNEALTKLAKNQWFCDGSGDIARKALAAVRELDGD